VKVTDAATSAAPALAAAFFDLDKTIIAKSSALAFGRPLYQAGFLNRISLLKAGIAQISYMTFGADHDQMERAREEMLEMTKGWDKVAVEQLVREIVDEVVSPLVYAEALALIDEHKRVGRKVVIISSSPEEIVKPLARYLGVDHVIATRAKIDDEGRYTGEMEFYAYAESKAEAIQELAAAEGLSLPDSFAYSDSVTDLPMLQAVGHPVVVNPDKELAQEAEERDWLTMDFERPVTIRTRLATLPRPVPLVSGAAMAGAAAGAIVLWMLKARQKLR
jgi:HAD superfamily hydrolase (TIGR01490 family)